MTKNSKLKTNQILKNFLKKNNPKISYATNLERAWTDSASWIRPPVGVASGVWQPLQKTGVFECENAVVTAVHVGQRSARNSERGFGTRVFFLFIWSSCSAVG